MNNLEPLIGALLVAAVLFFGYRIKRIALAILAFVIGYSIAGQYLTQYVEGAFLQTLLPLAIGLLLALLSASIENLAIFAVGAFTGYGVAGAYLDQNTWAGIGISIAIAVIIGTICVAIKKPAIIVLTAVASAHVIATAIITMASLDTHPYYLIIVAVLATIGALFQFKNTKGLA